MTLVSWPLSVGHNMMHRWWAGGVPLQSFVYYDTNVGDDQISHHQTITYPATNSAF